MVHFMIVKLKKNIFSFQINEKTSVFFTTYLNSAISIRLR